MSKTRFFVDAAPLVDNHLSGVGHATYHLVEELSRDRGFTDTHSIVLVVPYKARNRLSRWGFNQCVGSRSIPTAGRVIGRLTRHNLLPWMDLLLGRGVYLFPNFRNWPLRSSTSITYIHDVAFALHPESVEPSNLAYLAANVPGWISRATWVVTVSETSKREIAEKFRVDPAKIAVPTTVDRTRYRRSDSGSVEHETGFGSPGIHPLRRQHRTAQELPADRRLRVCFALTDSTRWSGRRGGG
jgi:hypothetical protein